MNRRRSLRAFTLIETGVTVGTLAVLTGVLLPALGNTRRAAQLAADGNNLRQLHAAGQNYAADFQGAVPTYSWRAGVVNPGQVGATPGTNDVIAAAAQANVILRRNGFGATESGSWIPHVTYSHLVLLEHMGESLLSPLSVSPADFATINARATIPTGSQPPLTRQSLLPFRTSYQLPPAFYAADQSSATQRINQFDTHSQYLAVGAMGNQRFDQVHHPSRKVYLHDTEERFFGRAPSPMWWRWSRINSVLVDGSVRILQARNSLQRLLNSTTNRRNPGAYWQANGTFLAASIAYTGWRRELGESPVPNSPTGDIITNGIYRWTAGGKQGMDVDDVSPFARNVTVPANQ